MGYTETITSLKICSDIHRRCSECMYHGTKYLGSQSCRYKLIGDAAIALESSVAENKRLLEENARLEADIAVKESAIAALQKAYQNACNFNAMLDKDGGNGK